MKMKFKICTRVFVALSILFMPPLGSMVAHMVHQDSKLQSNLASVQIVAHCIDCYLEENITGCEGCLERNNRFEDTNHKKYVAKENIGQVVKEMISRMGDLVQDGIGQYLAIENFHDMSLQIISPRLPHAHVHTNGQPTRNVRNNNWHKAVWEMRIGAERTTATYPNMLDTKNGLIRIPLSGTYSVYVHTTFVNNPNMNETSCTLGHEVVKGRSESLIMSQETVGCDMDVDYTRNRTDNDLIGFHTIHSEGAYQLEKGSTLTVYYKMPSSVDIGTLHTETYFGVFMV